MSEQWSPWVIDELPTEAEPSDVEAAQEALLDGAEADADAMLAAMLGVAPRTVRGWRRSGTDGPAAVCIHIAIRFGSDG